MRSRHDPENDQRPPSGPRADPTHANTPPRSVGSVRITQVEPGPCFPRQAGQRSRQPRVPRPDETRSPARWLPHSHEDPQGRVRRRAAVASRRAEQRTRLCRVLSPFRVAVVRLTARLCLEMAPPGDVSCPRIALLGRAGRRIGRRDRPVVDPSRPQDAGHRGLLSIVRPHSASAAGGYGAARTKQ